MAYKIYYPQIDPIIYIENNFKFMRANNSIKLDEKCKIIISSIHKNQHINIEGYTESSTKLILSSLLGFYSLYKYKTKEEASIFLSTDDSYLIQIEEMVYKPNNIRLNLDLQLMSFNIDLEYELFKYGYMYFENIFIIGYKSISSLLIEEISKFSQENNRKLVCI